MNKFRFISILIFLNYGIIYSYNVYTLQNTFVYASPSTNSNSIAKYISPKLVQIILETNINNNDTITKWSYINTYDKIYTITNKIIINKEYQKGWVLSDNLPTSNNLKILEVFKDLYLEYKYGDYKLKIRFYGNGIFKSITVQPVEYIPTTNQGYVYIYSNILFIRTSSIYEYNNYFYSISNNIISCMAGMPIFTETDINKFKIK